MKNIPVVKLGIVAVSRDCFPRTLSENRRNAVVDLYRKAGGEIECIPTIVETETDAIKAVAELNAAQCNAVVIYLGNFGPEGPETLIAKNFDGPAMFVAAAEDSDLVDNRGDAYCGMLNASYNIGLRGLMPYIPEYPVGDPKDVAMMIAEFVPVARVILGIKGLKIITFGPRPYDFLACNAPIKPLYDLGMTVQENSELDLLLHFQSLEGDPRIKAIEADMAAELGTAGNKMPALLPKLAQYELALLDWKEKNIGASQYVAFANKCWPGFQSGFGFVPCYVNGRFRTKLMPVACEVDIYGALSEYIIACATEIPPTLLDINNTITKEIYEEDIKGKFNYTMNDTFMGFHCGNSPVCHTKSPKMGYQLIMYRLNENGKEPNISRGTLDGDLKDGDITFFRLQGTADAKLTSYIAQGEILPVATRSFGSIGIFAIPEMGRFYRHVLIAKRYPHHGGVAFAHAGKTLFSAMKMLGVEDVAFNQPKSMLYKDENPFA